MYGFFMLDQSRFFGAAAFSVAAATGHAHDTSAKHAASALDNQWLGVTREGSIVSYVRLGGINPSQVLAEFTLAMFNCQ